MVSEWFDSLEFDGNTSDIDLSIFLGAQGFFLKVSQVYSNNCVFSLKKSFSFGPKPIRHVWPLNRVHSVLLFQEDFGHRK